MISSCIPKCMCLKTKAFSMHFDIICQIISLNSVLLREEEKAFLLKLLSEGRVLLQFHVQASSSAHQWFFRSTEPTVTVILSSIGIVWLKVWQQASGFLWFQGTILVQQHLSGLLCTCAAGTSVRLSHGWNFFPPLAEYWSILKIMIYR